MVKKKKKTDKRAHYLRGQCFARTGIVVVVRIGLGWVGRLVVERKKRTWVRSRKPGSR